MEQNRRQPQDRNVSKRDSAQRDSGQSETPPRPIVDRAYTGDRPKTAPESGLLRELKETPRHLD